MDAHMHLSVHLVCANLCCARIQGRLLLARRLALQRSMLDDGPK